MEMTASIVNSTLRSMTAVVKVNKMRIKIFMEGDLTGVVDEEVVCFDDTEHYSCQLSEECMDIEQWEDDDVPWCNEETVTD